MRSQKSVWLNIDFHHRANLPAEHNFSQKIIIKNAAEKPGTLSQPADFSIRPRILKPGQRAAVGIEREGGFRCAVAAAAGSELSARR